MDIRRSKKGGETGRTERRTPRSNVSTLSYYNNRSDKNAQFGRRPDDKAPAKRTKKNFFHHVPALLLLIAVLASVVFISTLNPVAKVVLVDVEKNATIRSEDIYRAKAEEFIAGSLINRSKLMFDSAGLVAEFKDSFPEVAAATVTVPIMGRRPVVEIQTTRPAFILASETNAVLVGNNGVALANTRDLKDLSKLGLRSVNDETGLDIEIGKPALPQEQAQFISVVVEQLEKQKFRIDSLTIPQSPYDLHVRLQGQKYFIKFNILEDPKQQAGAFVALQKQLSKDGKAPSQYVDVRVGERIFYK
jgi:hypothetical protein